MTGGWFAEHFSWAAGAPPDAQLFRNRSFFFVARRSSSSLASPSSQAALRRAETARRRRPRRQSAGRTPQLLPPDHVRTPPPTTCHGTGYGWCRRAPTAVRGALSRRAASAAKPFQQNPHPVRTGMVLKQSTFLGDYVGAANAAEHGFKSSMRIGVHGDWASSALHECAVGWGGGPARQWILSPLQSSTDGPLLAQGQRMKTAERACQGGPRQSALRAELIRRRVDMARGRVPAGAGGGPAASWGAMKPMRVGEWGAIEAGSGGLNGRPWRRGTSRSSGGSETVQPRGGPFGGRGPLGKAGVEQVLAAALDHVLLETSRT